MNMSFTLLDLIKLNEGQLSDSEADILHEAIRQDNELHIRWTILRQTYLRLLDPNAIRRMDESSSLSVTIASYIDQQLTPQEITDFEEKCWQENALLLEVLDCYQANISIGSSTRETGNDFNLNLSRRLQRIPSGNSETNASSLQSHTSPADVNGVQQATLNGKTRSRSKNQSRSSVNEDSSGALPANAEPKVQIVVDGPKKPSAPPQPSMRLPAANWMWWSTAIAILIGVGLAVVLAILNSGDPNRTADEKQKGIEQKEPDSRPKSPDKQDDEKSKRDTPAPFKDPNALTKKDGDSKQNFPDPKKAPIQDDPNSGKQNIVDNAPNKKSNESPPKNPKLDPTKNSNSNNKQLVNRFPTKMNLGWQAVRGLVTIKHNGESQWSSTREQSSFSNGSEFQVLPECWAEAKTNGKSVFVLNENSSVSLQSNRDGTQFAVDVKRGKTGFRDVEKGTSFDLTVGRAKLKIESLEDDSEFGIDYQNFQPRVFVRKGKMKINGKDAERGTQGTVQDANLIFFGKLQSFNEVRWLSKSTSKVNISVPVKALEKSLDIESDLKRMLSSKNEANKLFAVKSLLSIHSDNPTEFDRLIRRSLGGGNEVWVRATVEWLMTRDVHDPVARRAWRVANTFISSTIQNSPNLIKWKYKLIKEGTAASANELNSMFRMLGHPKLYARQFAFHSLSMKFGNKSGYQLNLPAAEQRVRLQRWRAEISAANAKLPK